MAAIAAAAGSLSAACGGGGGGFGFVDPDRRRTELVIEAAPEGLARAVVVDSAGWDPVALLSTGDPEVLEVEGPYRIVFRNTSEQALELRFDLRFYDVDDTLVDNFIPFGLPVVLAAGARRVATGTFVIRSDPEVGRFGLLTLRIAARIDSAAAAGGRPP